MKEEGGWGHRTSCGGGRGFFVVFYKTALFPASHYCFWLFETRFVVIIAICLGPLDLKITRKNSVVMLFNRIYE